LPKETHGGSTLFLHGLAVARRACTPTSLRLTLDGRAVRVGAGGRFQTSTADLPKRLLALDRRGLGTVHRFDGTPERVPAPSSDELRARRQIEARLARLARAVRREDLAALRRYDERPGAFEAWRGLLAVSQFEHARFHVGAFDAGALRCGGPVVAQVSWQLAGKVPPGITTGKDGQGTLGRPTTLLFTNHGSARAPDWRISYAIPFLPYPNAIPE
jgi:hypothetical protein